METTKQKTDHFSVGPGETAVIDIDEHILQEANELSQDPQFVDDAESQKVWEKLNAQKETEAEEKSAAKEPAIKKADEMAEDEVFVRGIDMLAGFAGGMLSGTWNEDRYCAKPSRLDMLIKASHKAGMGQKYAEKFGSEMMFWGMVGITYVPSFRLAVLDRKAEAVKNAAVKKQYAENLNPEKKIEDAGTNNEQPK